jgi:hypothetical protein
MREQMLSDACRKMLTLDPSFPTFPVCSIAGHGRGPSGGLVVCARSSGNLVRDPLGQHLQTPQRHPAIPPGNRKEILIGLLRTPLCYFHPR